VANFSRIRPGIASHRCAGAGKGEREPVGSGTEPKSRVGLGGLHECVEAGRGPRWGATRQAQVRENLDAHGGIFDGREEGQSASVLGAGGDGDGKDAFE